MHPRAGAIYALRSNLAVSGELLVSNNEASGSGGEVATMAVTHFHRLIHQEPDPQVTKHFFLCVCCCCEVASNDSAREMGQSNGRGEMCSRLRRLTSVALKDRFRILEDCRMADKSSLLVRCVK